VRAGLQHLGHDAMLSTHRVERDRINIIFGLHIFDPARLAKLPRGTIFYNLEQVVEGQLKPAF
jgi:hypothetical protein